MTQTVAPARDVRVGWALAGIAVAGAALRFSTLSLQSYWADEAATVKLLDDGLGHAVRVAANTEATPPLYYVVAWVWSRVFGTGEVALRSLSAILGTATILVVYVIGRRLASARVGLAAAAVVAVSPMFVWYAQEARAYALLGLLTAASFLFFAETARGRSGGAPALWAATSLLAVLTHWFAIFVVGAEALWLLARARDRLTVRWAVVAVAAGTAGLAPLALHQLHGTDREAAGLPVGHFPRVPPQLVIGYGISPLQVALGVLAGGLLLGALWLAARRTRGGERDLAVMAGTVAAVAAGTVLILALAGGRFLNAAHLHPVLVPIALVVGAGLGARGASPQGRAIGIALCAVLAAAVVDVFADPHLQRVDDRAAAHALGPAQRSRVIVFSDDPRGLDPYQSGVAPLPPRGRSVSEIDVVALSAPLGSHRTLPRPRRPIRAPAPGFVLTELREAPTFTLLRFDSATPRLVTVRLAQSAGLTASSTALLQPTRP